MENTDCEPLFGDSFFKDIKDIAAKISNKFVSNSNDVKMVDSKYDFVIKNDGGVYIRNVIKLLASKLKEFPIFEKSTFSNPFTFALESLEMLSVNFVIFFTLSGTPLRFLNAVPILFTLADNFDMFDTSNLFRFDKLLASLVKSAVFTLFIVCIAVPNL